MLWQHVGLRWLRPSPSAAPPAPAEVRRHFTVGKRTYIGPLEMLWAHSPYRSCRTIPEELEGTRPIHFIDNTRAPCDRDGGF